MKYDLPSVVTVGSNSCYWLLRPMALHPLGDVTSSMNFHPSSLHGASRLQVLPPTRATSCSNSKHHLNCALPPFLLPVPPGLAQGTFLEGSLSPLLITCPACISLPSFMHFTACCIRHTACVLQRGCAPSNIHLQVTSQRFSAADVTLV
jgi:hypothetical protein